MYWWSYFLSLLIFFFGLVILFVFVMKNSLERMFFIILNMWLYFADSIFLKLTTIWNYCVLYTCCCCFVFWVAYHKKGFMRTYKDVLFDWSSFSYFSSKCDTGIRLCLFSKNGYKGKVWCVFGWRKIMDNESATVKCASILRKKSDVNMDIFFELA